MTSPTARRYAQDRPSTSRMRRGSTSPRIDAPAVFDAQVAKAGQETLAGPTRRAMPTAKSWYAVVIQRLRSTGSASAAIFAISGSPMGRGKSGAGTGAGRSEPLVDERVDARAAARLHVDEGGDHADDERQDDDEAELDPGEDVEEREGEDAEGQRGVEDEEPQDVQGADSAMGARAA